MGGSLSLASSEHSKASIATPEFDRKDHRPLSVGLELNEDFCFCSGSSGIGKLDSGHLWSIGRLNEAMSTD